MWRPLLYRSLHLWRSQWLPPAKLQDLQQAKLQPLIAHAYRNVPYYRRLLDRAGITPQDIIDYQLPTHPLKDVDIKRAKDALKNDPFVD